MAAAEKINTKRKIANDTDSEDDEDEAQMRQFLEAADHTLLTNDMYQKPTKNSPAKLVSVINMVTADVALKDQPKSERFLDEQSAIGAVANDLEISEHMQTHIWRKLSAIIERQVEFSDLQTTSNKELKEDEDTINQVKLFSNANCYISNDLKPEKLPQKKPTIKRRQLEQKEDHSTETLALIAVSSESILSGQDTQCWAERKPRQDKLFKYKACDTEGHKLQAIEPTNEFTTLRRKNKWNETKIDQKNSNKKQKSKS